MGLIAFFAQRGVNPQCVARPSSSFRRSVVRSSQANNEGMCSGLKLAVSTSDSGYAKMTWADLPQDLLNDITLTIKLFQSKDGETSSENELYSHVINRKKCGAIDTNQYLNNSLKIKLVNKQGNVVTPTLPFDDAYWMLPSGTNMWSLQLYTKDGYAGARLHLKKPLGKDLVGSDVWVGFYNMDTDDHRNYQAYQW